MKKFLFIIFLLSSITVFAQDSIRTKSDTIIGKVVEIGLDEIKYKDWDNLDGPVIVIEKRSVMDIRYENGKKTILTPDEYEASKEVEIRNKKRAIKFEFFSPLTDDIAFGYETVLKVGTNLEFKIGYISPGLTTDEPKSGGGLFVKAGVKFLTSPTYYERGIKYAHGLKGFYIKPELIFSAFTLKENYYGYGYIYPYAPQNMVVETKSYNYAINLCFGKQHILGNIITLDYYLGLGYGFDDNSSTSNSTSIPYYNYSDSYYDYRYSHMQYDNNFVLSGGLTIGVLF